MQVVRFGLVAMISALSACDAADRNSQNAKDYSSFTVQTDPAVARNAAEPLVIVLGGSNGGLLRDQVLMQNLLNEGFSVAQMAYFRFEGGPRHLTELDIDKLAAAIADQSAGHGCTGVIGFSKGAELALVLAAYHDVADATVAVAPSDVVWQSSQISLIRRSSWMVNGEPLPFVPYNTFSGAAVAAAVSVNFARPLHANALQDRGAIADAFIPVEQINHPTLLQAPQHDQVWPSLEMSQQAIARASAARPDHPLILKEYDNDHFMLSHPQAQYDAIRFLQRHLDRACAGN